MKCPEILHALSAAFVPSTFTPVESAGVMAKHLEPALVINNRLIPTAVCAPWGLEELPASLWPARAQRHAQGLGASAPLRTTEKSCSRLKADAGLRAVA